MLDLGTLRIGIEVDDNGAISKLTGVKTDLDGLEKSNSNTTKSMSSAWSTFKGTISALGIGKLFQSIGSAIKNSMSSAISRVDTLNNYPKVMESLGYSAQDATNSINKLSDGLQGLPTALDDMVAYQQRITASTGDINKATDATLALNDMILAGGANSQVASSAMEQFTQMISQGTVDMQAWRSVLTACPGQVDKLAKSMLGAEATSDDLYKALQTNQLSMDDLLDAVIRLDKEGGEGFASFADQAKDATGGIETQMANVKTAITRNLGNVLQELQEQNVFSEVFGSLKKAINETGEVVKKFVQKNKTNIKQIVNTFKDVMKVVPDIVQGFLQLAPAIAQTTIAVKGAKVIVGIVNSIKGALNGLMNANPTTMLLTLASALGMLIALNLGKLVRNVNNYQTAVKNLKNPLKEATNASKDFGDAQPSVVQKLQNTREAVNDLYEDLANLSEELVQGYADWMTSCNYVDDLKGKLQELLSKDTLTTEEVAQVQHWFDLLNQEMGTNLQILADEQGGYQLLNDEIVITKDAVYDLINAFKAQALVELNNDKYKDLYTQREEALRTLKDAQDASAQAHKRLEDYIAQGKPAGTTYREWKEGLDGLETSANNADIALQEAQTAVDLLDGSMENLDAHAMLAQGAVQGIDQALQYFVATNQGLIMGLQDADINLVDFTQALQDAGLTTEQLAGITDEQWWNIINAYQNGATNIVDAMRQAGVDLEGIELPKPVEEDIQNSTAPEDAEQLATEVGENLDASEEATQAGESTMESYEQSFSNGEINLDGTKEQVGQELDASEQATTSADTTADAYTNELNSKLGEASGTISQSCQEILNQAVQPLENLAPMVSERFAGFGEAVSTAMLSGAGSIQGAVQMLLEGALIPLDNLNMMAQAKAVGVGNAIATGISSGRGAVMGAITAIITTITSTLSKAPAQAQRAGQQVGQQYANGINSTRGTVSTACLTLANCVSQLSTTSTRAYSYGYGLGYNFASGIRASGALAISAAIAISNAVKAILGHSVPKKGPLHEGGKGEKVWGQHLVQNMIAGIKSEAPALQRAVENLASYASGGASNAFSNPISLGNVASRLDSKSALAMANNSTSTKATYYTFAVDGINIATSQDRNEIANTITDTLLNLERLARL